MGTDGYRRRHKISDRRLSPGERPDYQFYGRRQGHRLRPGRKRLLVERLPTLRLPPADDAVAVAAACKQLQDEFDHLWLEIGFGGGEHLVFQAEQNPDVAVIGGEPFQTGVARVIAEAVDRGLDNIRLVDDDIRPWLPSITDQCIGRVFILFPDPWPKTRHHKRRIVTTENLDQLARMMGDGAELRFARGEPDVVTLALSSPGSHSSPRTRHARSGEKS